VLKADAVILVFRSRRWGGVGGAIGTMAAAAGPPQKAGAAAVGCGFCPGPSLCENSTRYKRTLNFEACGRAQSKKTQKFVLGSALRPNQISFSHSLGQKRSSCDSSSAETSNILAHAPEERQRPVRDPRDVLAPCLILYVKPKRGVNGVVKGRLV
jgi:hypothetical protein